MSGMIGWYLQHGFHDEWIFYSGYGEVQGRVASTCWVLGYAIMVLRHCRKFKMHWMAWIK
jgi:hypothetical protein